MSAIQTLWTEVWATALADAGVSVCVVSPGSRSTPLVAALARSRRFELPVIIDERAAGFFALSAARTSGRPVALVCTSGSAPGHYLPAVIEAAMAEIPLVVVSADRPPELHDAGASQTVPQRLLFAEQVRASVDLGPPSGELLAMRAVRRRVIQLVAAARGPVPGPVHLNMPLRKPLEPVAPSSEAERALAAEVQKLAALPVATLPSRLTAPDELIEELAAALGAEPRGMIVAGALPEAFAAAREDVFALATLLGYPLLAEAGSQLRFGPRPAALTALDHGDLVLAARGAGATPPRLLLSLGAEPVAPGWHAAQPQLAGCARWALGYRWQDPSSTSRVLLGEPATTLRRLRQLVEARRRAGGEDLAARATERASYLASYAAAEASAAAQLGAAIAAHPDSEVAALAAALAACAQLAARDGEAGAPRLLLGNSLPVRVIDQAAAHVPGLRAAAANSAAPTSSPSSATSPLATCSTMPFLPVATQRGASGIDGLLAGAAGAALDGRPVLLVIGDVTFAHDAGSLQVLGAVRTPVVVLVIDNGGGRIFDHLPVARAELEGDVYARFFTTPPRLDPVAVARGFGLPAHAAPMIDTAAGGAAGGETDRAAALTALVAAALATAGASLIHVQVATGGALAVRNAALGGLQPQLRMVQGATS